MKPIYHCLLLFSAFCVSGCPDERRDCASTAECREVFGLYSVCGETGYCQAADFPERCDSAFPPSLLTRPLEHVDDIVVGGLYDATRQGARTRAMALAAKQINSLDEVTGSHGIAGRDLAILFCRVEADPSLDTLTRTEAAVANGRFLAETMEVPAIIGPSASADVLAVAAALAPAQATMLISPAATSDAIVALRDESVGEASPNLVWRTVPTDAGQAAIIAQDIVSGVGRSQPIARLAIINSSDVYGTGLAEAVTTSVSASGITVTRLPYSNQATMADRFAEAGLSDAQEVLFVSSQVAEVIAFFDTTAGLATYDNKTLFVTDTAPNMDVLTNADPRRFGVTRGSRPRPLDENNVVYASFVAAYLSEFNEDARNQTFVAHAYDATWLVAYGIVWASQRGGIRGLNIARGLHHVSAGAATELRASAWATGQAVMATVGDLDVSGASGALDYSAQQELSGEYQVWIIANGMIVPAE